VEKQPKGLKTPQNRGQIFGYRTVQNSIEVLK